MIKINEIIEKVIVPALEQLANVRNGISEEMRLVGTLFEVIGHFFKKVFWAKPFRSKGTMKQGFTNGTRGKEPLRSEI